MELAKARKQGGLHIHPTVRVTCTKLTICLNQPKLHFASFCRTRDGERCVGREGGSRGGGGWALCMKHRTVPG